MVSHFSKLTAKQKREVLKLLDENPLLNLVDLRKEVSSRLNLEISRDTVWKIVANKHEREKINQATAIAAANLNLKVG